MTCFPNPFPKDGGLDGALREAETGRRGGRISSEMKEVRFSAEWRLTG